MSKRQSLASLPSEILLHLLAMTVECLHASVGFDLWYKFQTSRQLALPTCTLPFLPRTKAKSLFSHLYLSVNEKVQRTSLDWETASQTGLLVLASSGQEGVWD